ncbi:MAG: ABC transporter permease [Pseudoxanthomonas suwonensis]|nr:ABC transporter permease [Pseudoxanthomonas suwonensis]
MKNHPILSALKRHKTAVALILLQIAVACAILCNAVFVIGERVSRMSQSSGIDEERLVMIASIGLDPEKKASVRIAEDLDALRAAPGVESAIAVGQFPFANNSWNTSLSLKPDQQNPTLTTNMVTADPGFLQTSGLKLKQGRWFTEDEFQAAEVIFSGGKVTFPALVVTEDLAGKLFPGESALGKQVFGMGEGGSRIVGITAKMLAPGGQPSGDPANAYSSLFVPVTSDMSWYVLRTTPDQRAAVLKAGVDALNRLDPNRVINSQRTLEEMRSRYYSRDRAVTWLLIVVSVLLLLITAFGIGGLASFWVQQRTKQIGVRRALGATRGQILRYFQVENFLIVTGGVVLGMLLAFAINQLLMSRYELPRLPWQVLPIGALALWGLGQLAVLWPALRAASIPPATATRSV